VWETLKKALAGALGSKKALGTIIGGIGALATLLSTKFGISIELATLALTGLVALISAYVVGQGLADFGKEKAKLDAIAKEKADSVVTFSTNAANVITTPNDTVG